MGSGQHVGFCDSRFFRSACLARRIVRVRVARWYAIGQSKARLFALQKLARLQGPGSITSPTAAAVAARISASRHASLDMSMQMAATQPASAVRHAATAADLVLSGEGPIMPSPSATPTSALLSQHSQHQQVDWPIHVEADADALP